MANSPFKFLDSFTKEDKEIFFGREKEIEEIYSRVFQSNLLLVYGASGTGKTSLIQCGLSNKFNDSDWLPILIRRGSNIQKSIQTQLSNLAITPIKESASLKKSLQSLYLDHFKPIYLLFDQFEELFIFGAKDEIENFITEIAKVIKSDLQCKFIFIMRGEYLEHLTQFEEQIPNFFDNRIRIEKMTRKNAIEAITGPCKVFGIEVEEGFPQLLLDKISPSNSEIELTYLQVFLDKIYKKANPTPTIPKGERVSPLSLGERQGVRFTNQLLTDLGQIGDVLSDFLEEQIAKIPDSENALTVLKAFVSAEGTKRQINFSEINEFTRSLGKDLQRDVLENFIHQFVNLRILRDKDEHGKYELRHDSLAAKIYEKITLVEKEILQVRQMIANRFSEFEMRGILLSEDDLRYIAPYENRLFLRGKLDDFYRKSKEIIETNRKLKKRVSAMSLLSLILLLGAVSYYLYQKNLVSRANELAAMALINVEKDPTLAYLLAEEAHQINPKSELALKALLESYYSGPFYNTIIGNEYTVSPDGKRIITTSEDSTVRIFDMEGNLLKEIKDSTSCYVLKNGFSPDGKYFLVDCNYRKNGKRIGYTIMFDMSGSKLRIFNRNTMDYNRPAFFSKEGNHLLLSDINESNVIVYDLTNDKSFELRGWVKDENTVAISPVCDLIAFAASDNSVRIWDMSGNEKFVLKGKAFSIGDSVNIISKSGKEVYKIKRENRISGVSFSDNGDLIAVEYLPNYDTIIYFDEKPTLGSTKRCVDIWSTEGKFLQTFKNYNKFSISPDGNYILTIYSGGLVKIWTIEGKNIAEIKGYSDDANFIFHATSMQILVNEQSEKTDVWDLYGNLLTTFKGDNVCSSRDGKYVITVDDEDNIANIYKKGDVIRLKGSNESINDHGVTITNNNKYVITAGNSAIIKIWKPDFRDFNQIKKASFSPDGTLILGLNKSTAKIFNRSGKIDMQFSSDENEIYDGLISPDNKFAFFLDSKDQCYLWNVITNNLVKKLRVQNSMGTGAAFSYNGKYFAFISESYQPQIIDLEDKYTSVINMTGHNDKVNCIDFSPRSNFAVTASDCTAIVWDLDTAHFSAIKFSLIKGHTANVNSAKFSPDGKYVITGSDDSTVRIWNLNGEQIFGINIMEYHSEEKKEKRMKIMYADFSLNAAFIRVLKYSSGTFIGIDPLTLKTRKQERTILGSNLWRFTGDWNEPFFEQDYDGPFPDISADGNYVVYYKDQFSKVITIGKREITSFRGGQPKFSPDGKYVMTIDNEQLKLHPITADVVIHLVRDEKIFGNIRDFTPKEREEYGLEKRSGRPNF